MVIQWVAAAVAASIITPRTWIGADSSLHDHIPAAIVIGGCLCLPSLLFVLHCPGAKVNRYLIEGVRFVDGVNEYSVDDLKSSTTKSPTTHTEIVA